MPLSRARLLPLLLLAASLGTAPLARASEEGQDLRAADAALNVAYQNALKAMPSADLKTKLREAQRAWVAFRDAEIVVNGNLPGATGNLLKMLQTELTETRTKQLKDLVEAAR